ncbi:hypothetical protein FA10DRAFT_182895 [Acaromyces ingoldii]|uniref:Uncharacterized protein n=1 Tax=Acaromyces ingoldii TaxID=215250 RepID=A0A316YDN9_9BASI|nr:hypothetical protein FA10DRAFT_182895 [Acaromyces ingoldii]PWN87312.1 hypothetical protein FA10DRAFT_182895 [Acaromyces ingoldii]
MSASMRCLLAISIGGFLFSSVLGQASNDKPVSSRNNPTTQQVVTPSHTPLSSLPDRPQSAARLLVQLPSVSCEDRSHQAFHVNGQEQSDSLETTTHDLHLLGKTPTRQVRSPLGCNDDTITTYIRSNGREKTWTKVFRPAVDRSSSHTVYGLINGLPSSPHAHNGADDAYEDKRLRKRGWIEDTAALI